MSIASASHERYRWPLLRAGLARGQSVSLTVRGLCMWPALRPGDRVRVRALASGESCLGKVVVCMHGERCHAHRVVELGNDLHGEPFVRCRGDDSPRLDGPVSTCDVIGEVVEVERHGRTVRVLRAASPISSLLAHVRPVLWRLRRRY